MILPTKTIRHWLWRCALALVGLSVVLLGAGAVYQGIAEARDMELFPPPGELIDIGGVSLHLNCTGRGQPTVVVEAGNGDFSLSWRDVQPKIANDTRICTYDRAGFGWSDYDYEFPSTEHVIGNLRTLLGTADIDPPYILVGHSLGGIFVRRFAVQYPDEVVGMVLVDSAHENQLLRETEESRAQLLRLQDRILSTIRRCEIMAPFGIVRLLRQIDNRVPPGEPTDIRGMIRASMYRTHFCEASKNARLALRQLVSQSDAPPELGDLPLVVLTRGLPNAAPRTDRVEVERSEAAWRALQDELAGLSTDSSHRIVTGTGHFIHAAKPDSVVAAILEVMAETRR